MKKKYCVFENRFYILFLFVSACLLSSCNKNPKDSQLLETASDLLKLNADSALVLLDSIEHPSNLSKEEYMKFLLMKTEAKYRTYKDISQDTVIFEAKSYFEKQNRDKKSIALANFYAGCVLREQSAVDSASSLFFIALNNIKELDEPQLKGLINNNIAGTYYKKDIFDSAIVHYKLSLQAYAQAEGRERQQMRTINAISLSYHIRGLSDSALLYASKGLEIAEKLDDRKYQIRLLNLKGLSHTRLGDYQLGKQFLHKTLALAAENDSISTAHIFSNLSEATNGLHETDSANYYGQLAEKNLVKTKDHYVHTAVYDHLSTLNAEQGKYKEALKYYKLFSEHIQQVRNQDRGKALLRIQKKYDFSQRETALAQLQTREQVYIFLILITLLLLLLASFAMKIARNKHKQQVQKNDMLDKQMKNILFLNNIYRNITSESTMFEKEVESLSLNYSIKDKSKGYEVIQNLLREMKKDTQKNLYDLNLGFLKALDIDDRILDVLNTSDMFFLSLSYCKYEFKEIASILGVSPHALQMRRQRMIQKTEKSGISNTKILQILK